jgi:predicted GNAT family acetyltransferase
MIRLLAEHDREQVLGLLAPEGALNLFIIGDVENNGFGQDFQQLWGDFEATGRLRAVLLRYYGSFIPYAPGEFDLDGLAEVLIGNRDRITAFSGIDRVIRPFETYPGLVPENARKRTLSFLELRGGDRLSGPEGGGPGGQAFRAGPDDVPTYLRLWAEVNGLERSDELERSHRREIEQGSGRVYFLRQDDRVVATVKTTAETSSGGRGHLPPPRFHGRRDLGDVRGGAGCLGSGCRGEDGGGEWGEGTLLLKRNSLWQDEGGAVCVSDGHWGQQPAFRGV